MFYTTPFLCVGVFRGLADPLTNHLVLLALTFIFMCEVTMEEQLKSLINNINDLLKDIYTFKDDSNVLINVINSFQDENVEILRGLN